MGKNAFRTWGVTTFFVISIIGHIMAYFAFLTPVAALTTTPATMNFQGRLTTAAGAVVADGLYNMKFALYDAASAGTLKWSETRETTTRVQVTNGLFTTKLGEATPLDPTIFASGSLYFQITMATPATANCSTAACASWESPMTTRSLLSTSAYAYNSETLDGLDSAAFGQLSTTNTWTNTNTVSITNATALKVQNATGTSLMTADTSGGQVLFGSYNGGTNPMAGKIVFANASNANTVAIVSGVTTGAGYSLTLPTALGASGDCLKDTNGSGALGFGSCGAGSYINNNTSQQTSASFNIDGTGKIATALSTPALRPIADSTTALQVQNAAGTTTLMNFNTTDGTVSIRAGSDAKTLGAELYSGNFSTNWTTTNWNVAGVTTAIHNTGNTSSLINTGVAITGGNTYQVSFTISGACGTSSDTISAYIGNATLVAGLKGSENCSGGYTYLATASNTTGLTFTPTASWGGTISAISIKQLSGTINPTLTLSNSSGTANIEIRTSSATGNTFIGLNSGKNNTTGSNNTANGSTSLQNNTTGSNNAANGSYSLQNNTTGSSNTANGSTSLQNNTTGNNNTANGSTSLQNNTTGFSNTASGSYSLQNNTTGSYNTALGYAAGHQESNAHFATGATLQRATAIGAYAQVQANDSIVLGSVDTLTKVGIGITVPSNMLSVSPVDLNSATITATQSGTTVTASSSIFTTAHVGEILVWADGTTDTITNYTSGTQVTVQNSVSRAVGSYFRTHIPAFNVTSAGNVLQRTTSATAFQVQTMKGTSVMTADTSGGQVLFGSYNGGTNAVAGKLVLANTTNANTVTIATGATSGAGYTMTLPTAPGANGDCLKTSDTSATLTFGACTTGSFINNTSSPQTADFNVTGTGTVGTALVTPIIRPTSDSATALRVQNSGGTVTLMTFDTSTPQVVVGSLTNGVTFSANGISYFGTAQKTYTHTMSPEYPGATFTPDGSNNTGTLGSDFCSGSSRQGINTSVCAATVTHNYYQWTTASGTPQDYDVYVRYQMPSDYETGSLVNMSIWGWGTNTTNEQVTVALYSDASGTACTTTSNAVTGATTWAQATTASPLGSCTIVAGDTVTFKVHLQAGTGNYARAGELSFAYKKKF